MLAFFQSCKTEVATLSPSYNTNPINVRATFWKIENPAEKREWVEVARIDKSILPPMILAALDSEKSIIAGGSLLSILSGAPINDFDVYTSDSHVTLGLLFAKFGYARMPWNANGDAYSGPIIRFTRFGPETSHIENAGVQGLEELDISTQPLKSFISVPGILRRAATSEEEALLMDRKQVRAFCSWINHTTVGTKIPSEEPKTVWKMTTAPATQIKTPDEVDVIFVENPTEFVEREFDNSVCKTIGTLDGETLVIKTLYPDHLSAGTISYAFHPQMSLNLYKFKAMRTREQKYFLKGFKRIPGSSITRTHISAWNLPRQPPPFGRLLAIISRYPYASADFNIAKTVESALADADQQPITERPSRKILEKCTFSLKNLPFMVLCRNPQGPVYARGEPHLHAGHATSFNFTQERSLLAALTGHVPQLIHEDFPLERSIVYMMFEKGTKDMSKIQGIFHYSHAETLEYLEDVLSEDHYAHAKEIMSIPNFEFALFGLE